MAFTVRYVPLSPRMYEPAPQPKTSELTPFQFVPLTQDILDKARKHLEDLVRDLSYTPVATPFDQMGFPTFSPSLSEIQDVPASAPIANPDFSEQQEYLSFLEQNNQSELTAFPMDDPSDFNMDTAMNDLTNLEESMAWNITEDQLREMENWDVSSDAELSAEASSELEALLASTDQFMDPSNLELLQKQLEEFEREFYGGEAPPTLQSSTE